MRSFIIAAVILLLIIAVISVNSFYIVSRVDSLLILCDLAENDSSAANVDRLVREWQSCRNIIALAVHKTELERAEDAILSLKSYVDEPAEFTRHMSLLRSALKHISTHQRITLDSIL